MGNPPCTKRYPPPLAPMAPSKARLALYVTSDHSIRENMVVATQEGWRPLHMELVGAVKKVSPTALDRLKVEVLIFDPTLDLDEVPVWAGRIKLMKPAMVDDVEPQKRSEVEAHGVLPPTSHPFGRNTLCIEITCVYCGVKTSDVECLYLSPGWTCPRCQNQTPRFIPIVDLPEGVTANVERLRGMEVHPEDALHQVFLFLYREAHLRDRKPVRSWIARETGVSDLGMCQYLYLLRDKGLIKIFGSDEEVQYNGFTLEGLECFTVDPAKCGSFYKTWEFDETFPQPPELRCRYRARGIAEPCPLPRGHVEPHYSTSTKKDPKCLSCGGSGRHVVEDDDTTSSFNLWTEQGREIQPQGSRIITCDDCLGWGVRKPVEKDQSPRWERHEFLVRFLNYLQREYQVRSFEEFMSCFPGNAVSSFLVAEDKGT